MKTNPNETEITIPVTDAVSIKADLTIVPKSDAIVLFAHGSGSSRFSPRNRFVAEVLQKLELSTLMIDLLTEEEEALDIQTHRLRFDIDLLTQRVIASTDYLSRNENTQHLRIGYFGSSTGASAALAAAADLGQNVGAVVSRGGRPDLAGDKLQNVIAPTLLVVGGDDFLVIDINKQAYEKINAEKELLIVPHATHLFEEPGALAQVAQAAAKWFVQHLYTYEKQKEILAHAH